MTGVPNFFSNYPSLPETQTRCHESNFDRVLCPDTTTMSGLNRTPVATVCGRLRRMPLATGSACCRSNAGMPG